MRATSMGAMRSGCRGDSPVKFKHVEPERQRRHCARLAGARAGLGRRGKHALREPGRDEVDEDLPQPAPPGQHTWSRYSRHRTRSLSRPRWLKTRMADAATVAAATHLSPTQQLPDGPWIFNFAVTVRL
jgi:hypothetical protein